MAQLPCHPAHPVEFRGSRLPGVGPNTILHQKTHPVSCILYPVSSIQYPVSSIKYPLTTIQSQLNITTMLKITTTQLNHHTSKSLYEWLFVQNETTFQIIIPRLDITAKTDNYAVFEEYLLAAYAGHRLSEIAQSFAYHVPAVSSTQPFVFEVTITEKGKMAEVLFIIIQSINDKIPSEIFLSFHSLAADYITNVLNDEVECNTWGLLSIAKQYLQKS